MIMMMVMMMLLLMMMVSLLLMMVMMVTDTPTSDFRDLATSLFRWDFDASVEGGKARWGVNG